MKTFNLDQQYLISTYFKFLLAQGFELQNNPKRENPKMTSNPANDSGNDEFFFNPEDKSNLKLKNYNIN